MAEMHGPIGRLTSASAACLAAASIAHAGVVQDHYGRWMGKVTIPQGPTLSTGVELLERADGSAGGRLVSPDQGDFNVPLDLVSEADGAIEATAPTAGITLHLVPVGDRLEGEARQGPLHLPLTLARAADFGEPGRPQTPKPPFPYRVESLSVTTRDGVVLSGTLTRPRGDRPVTAIVLLHGSGPADRDETIAGHKPFAILADHLTREGFAVFRYDKRGILRSGGHYVSTTGTELAEDGADAVEALRARRDIAHVGLIGHSEGGLLAAQIAAEHPQAIAFVVSLAGPGMKGRELILLQDRVGYEKRGLSEAQIAVLTSYGERFYDAVIANPDVATRIQALGTLRQSLSDADRTLVQQYASQGSLSPQMAATPALREVLLSDAPSDWRRVRCPVLALNGGLDVQVPARENLRGIARALAEGGNTKARTQLLPGLNHLFQQAGTGLGEEYPKIEQTLSPIALSRIDEFVEQQR
jgi:pimeloyl-ACP methyl ester carboxylesterase